jgi:hypothetical protein
VFGHLQAIADLFIIKNIIRTFLLNRENDFFYELLRFICDDDVTFLFCFQKNSFSGVQVERNLVPFMGDRDGKKLTLSD